MSKQQIPYKIYLDESEMPKSWYNLRADMKTKPAPLLNGQTFKPVTADELKAVFCDELVVQELDDTTPYIAIPHIAQLQGNNRTRCHWLRLCFHRREDCPKHPNMCRSEDWTSGFQADSRCFDSC